MEIISKFLFSTKSVTDQFYRRTTSVTFQVDIHVLQKTYKIKLLYKRDKFVCIITTLRLTSVSKKLEKTCLSYIRYVHFALSRDALNKL